MPYADVPFTVESRSDTGGAVIAPRGELDIATVDRVHSEADAAIRAGAERVVLDLRGVTFLDSTGLRMLFSVDATARRHGAEFSVVEGGARVAQVLELSGAWQVLRRADAPV